jgi:hypothetical protein
MVYKISNDVNVIANQKENNNLPDIATQTIDPISSIKQGTRNALFGAEATKAGPRLGQVLAISTNILKPAELNYFSNDTIKTESGDQAWMCAICRIPDMHGAVPDPDSVVDTTTGQITIKDWTRLRANIGKFYAPAASILAKGVTSVEIGDWLEVEFQDNTIFANGIIKSVYHKTNAAGYGAPGVGGPAGTPTAGGPILPGVGCTGTDQGCVYTRKDNGQKVCLTSNKHGTFPDANKLKERLDRPDSKFSRSALDGPMQFVIRAFDEEYRSRSGGWKIDVNPVLWVMIAAVCIKESGKSGSSWLADYNSNPDGKCANHSCSGREVRNIRNNNPHNMDGIPQPLVKGDGTPVQFSMELPNADGKIRFFRTNTMPAGIAAAIRYIEETAYKGKGTAAASDKCLGRTGGVFCGWNPGLPMTFRQYFYTAATPNENNPEGYCGSVLAALKAYGFECQPDEFIFEAVIRHGSAEFKGKTPNGSALARAEAVKSRNRYILKPDQSCPPSFAAELAGTGGLQPPPQAPPPAPFQTGAASAPLPVGRPRF